MDPPREVPAPLESPGHWPQSVQEFEILVETLQHELVHFAFSRLQNPQDAEDVVQDVLIRAYMDRHRHRAVTKVRPYLYRMVSNRCVDVLRTRQRNAPLGQAEGDPLPAGAALAHDWESAADRARRMETLLSALPARQADVIRLRASSGLPFASIAEVTGAPLPTVKSRFRYGIQRLRKILSKGEAQI